MITSRDVLAMLLLVQPRMLLAFTPGMHWWRASLREEQGEQMHGLMQDSAQISTYQRPCQ